MRGIKLTRGMGHSKLVVTTCMEGPLAMLSPEVVTPLESASNQLQTPLPGFAVIANTLQRSQLPQPLLAEEQALPWVVGSTLVVSRMIQDVWGMMTIDMMTCQLNVMGLEPAQPSSTVTISKMLAEMPTLEDASESED